MKIAKEFRWEMGHRLPYHTAGCQNIHGHSYKLIVELEGEVNDRGMLVDYGDIKRIVKPLIDELDHSFLCYEGDVLMKELLKKADLRAIFVPFYATAENLCTYFMQHLTRELTRVPDVGDKQRGTVRRIKVRVYEKESAYAELTNDEFRISNFESQIAKNKESLSNESVQHSQFATHPSRELAVVLVSGGMDSCVTAAIANLQYDMAFLHLNYGQRTEKRELKAFHDLADFYKVDKRLVVSVTHLSQIGGSSLTDTNIKVAKADLKRKAIPTSYVPFRNAHILSVAVSWGEVIGATKIFIGAVEEDSSGYPDCRKEYYAAFNRVIELGTKPETHIEIITPVIDMKKSEIVKKGMELNVPLHLTWSCYQNEDKACGICDSCALRLRGFSLAGIEDPLPYEMKPNYLEICSNENEFRADA